MPRRAFTLIELIVAIAIVMLLVGIVSVAISAVRASSSRADSMGALRQMAMAHSQYSQDHRAQLLPGYIDASLMGAGQPFAGLDVALPSGFVLGDLDAQSYVWRLASYLDDDWRIFYKDLPDPGPVSQLASEYGVGDANGVYGPAGSSFYAGGIAERPSFGLNSIFVGGDQTHGGPFAFEHSPWRSGALPKIAATRVSEAKNPSRVIVFGPAALAGTASADTYDPAPVGFCELRPPYLDGTGDAWELPQWTVGSAGAVLKTAAGAYNAGAGLPVARRGKQELIPVVHLDGSAAMEEISTLSRDMRRWDPAEVGLRDVAGE